MRPAIFFGFLLLGATRAALAVTCGGFSVVPADHVIVRYSASLPTGAAHSTPLVSVNGTEISVTRTISGGSLSDQSCVDDTIDLGAPAGGRFHLTWNDNANFVSQPSTFTFVVGSPSPGWTSTDTLVLAEMQVLPPLLPDQPVQMEVLGCSGRPPVAYVSGAGIEASTDKDSSGNDCKVYVLNLGVLGPGDYKVTLSFVPKPNVYEPWSAIDRFVVQQPPPSSLCGSATRVARTPNATAHLHYESGYYGYAPVFGLPAVTGNVMGVDSIPNGRVTVVQPVADSGKPSAPNAVPRSVFCHAEDIDLGPLDDGYQKIEFWANVSVNGVSVDYQSGDWFDFYWQNGDVQCTRSLQVLTSWAPEGIPFNVTARVLGTGWMPGIRTVTVIGHTINVQTSLSYFGSYPGPPPQCETHTATIGPLPAGEYTLVWRANSGQPATSHLTIGKPARQRAARH